MVELDETVKNLLKQLDRQEPTNPKDIVGILKYYPLSLRKIDRLVNENGATFVVEPLLCYNKFLRLIRLTANPQMGDEVIKVLRFDPAHLNKVLLCNYYTTGTTIAIRDTIDINVLIIANSREAAESLQKQFKF